MASPGGFAMGYPGSPGAESHPAPYSPGGGQPVAPGSITYTTSTGQDGKVIYHPFRYVITLFALSPGHTPFDGRDRRGNVLSMRDQNADRCLCLHSQLYGITEQYPQGKSVFKYIYY